MKIRKQTAVFLRVGAIIMLFALLQGQVYFRWNVKRPDVTLFDDIPEEKYTAEDFNRSLPFDNGKYDSSEAESATKYFHLPTWSKAYRSCENHPELSCFELVRAYRAVKEYVNKYSTGGLAGYVKVNISDTMPLHCRMSSFYNAFLVSFFTNRRLVIDSNETETVWLRREHLDRFGMPESFPIKKKRHTLPNNFTFSCEELMVRGDVLEMYGCMWPQIAYIHEEMAPKMRSLFGIHAMYYIGNWLFNTDELGGCGENPGNVTVGVPHEGLTWNMREETFKDRCGECERFDKMTVIRESEKEGDRENMCKVRQMMQSKRIVYSFGAVTPWFAMAMQGSSGGAVDLHGRKCMNFRNSQCGSLIHTYNPVKPFHYTTNNDFLVCGPNFNDARLYMRYLLW